MTPQERLSSLFEIAQAMFADTLHWWISELSEIVPESLKQKLFTPKEVLAVGVGPTEAVLRRIFRGSVAEIRRLPLAELDAESTLTSNHPAAVVGIAREQAFIDRFDLPAAARSKLRQIVPFQIESRSPLRKDAGLFDFSLVGQDKHSGTLTVEWAVVPAVLVHRAEAAARALGCHPAKVGIEGEEPGGLRYVFAQHRVPQVPLGRHARLALISAAVLFVGSLIFATSTSSGEAARLAHGIAETKNEALKAGESKARAESSVSALTLVAARAKEPKVSDILAEVTKALPDDTWLASAELTGNELTLIGTSGSASALIEKLVAVPIFEHPHFRTAITPVPTQDGSKAERFDIALNIKGRAARQEKP